MSTRVYAMISFAPGGEPAPWDGLLIQEDDHMIRSLDLLVEGQTICKLEADGSLWCLNDQGDFMPTTDMEALGRTFYRAMIGKEPAR